MARGSLEGLPTELWYIIARAFLPALCALRASCKALRAALWDLHLKDEVSLCLTPEEVTLGTCELVAQLPCLERVMLAHSHLAAAQGDWLLCIDVRALREASSVCIHPTAASNLRAVCRYRSWAAGNETCVWAVSMQDENSMHRTMNAEVVALLCAPILRTNQQLAKLIIRIPARGAPLSPSHINVPLLRSGRCERWSQIFVSATRSLSPETPLDNLSAVLVAGLLTTPTPLEFRIDLTGLRAVCGAALAFAEVRSKRRFVRPQEPPPSPSPVALCSPSSVARSKLLAARVAHRSPWGVGPNAGFSDSENESSRTSGGLLRPLLVRLLRLSPPPQPFGVSSPIALPERIDKQIAMRWVAMRWYAEIAGRWQEEVLPKELFLVSGANAVSDADLRAVRTSTLV